jgi:hypothetical protein
MAAAPGQTNISKYLLGNNIKSVAKQSTLFPGSKVNNGSFATTKVSGIIGGSGISRIIAYILSIVVVIFVILLFIHFFIKPVFILRPGSPGIIRVPGFDDGTLFWNKTNPGQIQNKNLPIHQQYFNYSLIIDMFIQNPLQFSSHPRVLFSRGAEYKQKPSGDTLLGVMDNYNLVIALLPDTNDLIISVLNKDNNMENIIISNIPVQEPFRLGVIMMENALEVYMNGRLMKTKTFSAPPKDVKGDIYPALGIEANIAKLRNLKIWNRILTTSEIRDAQPSLSAVSDFNPSPIPTSSTCPTSRFDKLSVGIMPNLGQNIMPNLGQNILSDLGQNIIPNLSQNILPDLGKNIIPDLGQNIMPDLGKNIIGNYYNKLYN